MNKMKKILFIALSTAVLLLTACKHDLAQGTVKGEGITADKTVTFNLSTNGDYTVFSTKNNSSRTIVSSPYAAGELKFYMYGTNTTKGTYVGLKEITVNSTNGKTGTSSLEIGSYVWDLTIIAYPTTYTVPATLPVFDNTNEATILAEAVLVGRASADLRGDTNNVDFVLMPDGLTKTGNIAIKLYTGGWTMDTSYTAKVGIYDHETGTEIYTLSTSKASGSTEESFASPTLIPATTPTSANYTAGGANIAPGNGYDLVVEFTSPNGKKYYWSDNLIVLPGKGNTETVIIPDTIMLPPDPPTDFKAGYFVPSINSSLYEVEFTWTRSAGKTEKYYELQIADLGVPDTATNVYTTPTSDANWETMVYKEATGSTPESHGFSSLTTFETFGMNFYKNPYIWVAGSLLKGNQTATAKLVLGNRYFVRIRAVNDAGESEWVYPSLSGTGTTNNMAFTSPTINLYRLSYQTTDMDGKTVTYTPTTGVTPAFENVTYHCQDATTGIPIALPYRSAEEVASTSINRDVTVTDISGAYWTYWKDYNETNVDPENYKSFENLTLIPVFSKLSNITIHSDADYLMDKSNITLTKVVGSAAAGTIDANNSIVFDLNEIQKVEWKLTYPTGIVYEYCYLTLAKTSSLTSYVYIQNINTSTLKFPDMDLTDCEASKYQAVIHYGINNKDYTLPINVSIVE